MSGYKVWVHGQAREVLQSIISTGLRWSSGSKTVDRSPNVLYFDGGSFDGFTQSTCSTQKEFKRDERQELTIEELYSKIGFNKSQQTNQSEKVNDMTKQIKVGDKVKVTADEGGEFYSEHEGKIGVVTEIRGQNSSDRVYVDFPCGDTDYGRVGDVTPVGRSGSTYADVYRAKFLYNTGEEFSVGGLCAFNEDSQNSKEEDCFEFTKRMDKDLEQTSFIRKADVAAIVLRYGNGESIIKTFNDNVVQTVDVRLQAPTAKTILTPEQRVERAERRTRKAAERLAQVNAKGGAKDPRKAKKNKKGVK